MNIKELEKRKEAIKKMAIDYKKEWEKLHNTHGGMNIRVAGTLTRLSTIMNIQIQNTIDKREKLMEVYVKEKIITQIDTGEKGFHIVNVIRVHRSGSHSLLATISVGKKDFDYWCEKKGGK